MSCASKCNDNALRFDHTHKLASISASIARNKSGNSPQTFSLYTFNRIIGWKLALIENDQQKRANFSQVRYRIVPQLSGQMGPGGATRGGE